MAFTFPHFIPFCFSVFLCGSVQPNRTEHTWHDTLARLFKEMAGSGRIAKSRKTAQLLAKLQFGMHNRLDIRKVIVTSYIWIHSVIAQITKYY